MCGCKSELVRDRAHGFDCPGQRGAFLLGCWLQGVRYPVAGALPSMALDQEERLQGHIPDSLYGCREPWPGEDASMKAVLPRAGAGTVLLMVAVHQLCAD